MNIDAAKSGEIRIIDATGLRCPLPVVRMEAALRRMKPGETLEIRADDPIAAVDIPHFCQMGGHGVDRLPADGDFCVFLVTRGENPDNPAG
jgi:tRNA 2-thiouridine synthesizing protein A